MVLEKSLYYQDLKHWEFDMKYNHKELTKKLFSAGKLAIRFGSDRAAARNPEA